MTSVWSLDPTHLMDVENRPSEAVIWPPHSCCHTHDTKHTPIMNKLKIGSTEANHHTRKWKKISFSEPGLLHFLYFCSHINFSANFLISSCSWIQFRRVYVSHCLYPFISWWMSRMTLCSSWCEYIKHEQGCAVYLCEKIKRPFSTWPVMVQSGHIIILFLAF